MILSPEIKTEIEELIIANNKAKMSRNQDFNKEIQQLEELKQSQELKNISLLLTASKLIKTATKKMSELIPIELRNTSNFKDKIRILKFKNYESYLYGDDQLIYY